MICLPVNDGGVRGLAVIITDGTDREEVGRVAFVRQNSENPDVKFEDQLDEVLERGDHACEVINDLAAELERQREVADAEHEEREAEKIAKAREQLRGVLPSRRAHAKMG